MLYSCFVLERVFMDINKTLNINNLIDFYGELLTPKQQQILKDYYFYNISLSEIAENLSISRQAVRDSLKTSEKLMLNFENKLKLIAKHEAQCVLVSELSQKYNCEELLKVLKVWEG